MKSKLLMMFALFISMALLTSAAEARRFGGGRSFGKSWSSPTRSTSSFSKKTSSFSSGKGSMFKGALMGLMAGGLIGSLLSGGGFHGMQGFDFLLLGGLAFLIYFLYQRKKMALGTGGGNNSFYQGSPEQVGNHSSRFTGGQTSSVSGSTQYPAWFDEKAFVKGAKNHFMTLQMAWDQNDLSLMQTYCVSEFYQSLVNERAMLSGPQNTEVLSLTANLLNIVQEGAYVIAGVEFCAEIKSNNEPVEKVREIWSIQHASHHGAGDWLIVGIDQK